MSSNTSSLTMDFYKEVTLDSAQFRTGSIDRPTFYFDNFMDTMDFITVNRVILPTTYYVFSAPSYVSCTIGGTAVAWPAGNYTPDEWIAIVQPQVVGLTITYSLNTGKLTFAITGVFSIVFSATELAYEQLGFPAGTTLGTNMIVAPSVADFSGPNYAILHAKMASVFNGASIYYSRLGDDRNAVTDKLAMIPIDQNRNSVVFYESTRDQYFEWFDTQTRNLEFYFTLGTRKEIMTFNGNSFQIQLGGKSVQNLMRHRYTPNIAGVLT